MKMTNSLHIDYRVFAIREILMLKANCSFQTLYRLVKRFISFRGLKVMKLAPGVHLVMSIPVVSNRPILKCKRSRLCTSNTCMYFDQLAGPVLNLWQRRDVKQSSFHRPLGLYIRSFLPGLWNANVSACYAIDGDGAVYYP